MLGASWLCLRVGVANNEDSGTAVGSPHVPCVNPKGTRSVTEHVQPSPQRGQPLAGGSASDILDNDDRRADFADDPEVLTPQA